MFFHGADQGGEDLPADHTMDHSADQSAGDGFHHHEIHEDESGFHSMHTHPDGRQEPGDHATYEEAKQHMDSQMGHGDADGDNDMHGSGRDPKDSFDDGSGDDGDSAEAYRKSCG